MRRDARGRVTSALAGKLLTIGEWLTMQADNTEASIEESWERLGELLEAGELNDAQHEYLLRMEVEFGEGPVSRWMVSKYLTRAVLAPAHVGPEVPSAPYSCRCGAGRGWLTTDTPNEVTPCPECNTACWELYIAGCLAPGHHGCSKCTKHPTRKRAPGTSHHDLMEAEHEDERRDLQRSLDDDII